MIFDNFPPSAEKRQRWAALLKFNADLISVMKFRARRHRKQLLLCVPSTELHMCQIVSAPAFHTSSFFCLSSTRNLCDEEHVLFILPSCKAKSLLKSCHIQQTAKENILIEQHLFCTQFKLLYIIILSLLENIFKYNIPQKSCLARLG